MFPIRDSKADPTAGQSHAVGPELSVVIYADSGASSISIEVAPDLQLGH
jgi:hypothetical protein